MTLLLLFVQLSDCRTLARAGAAARSGGARSQRYDRFQMMLPAAPAATMGLESAKKASEKGRKTKAEQATKGEAFSNEAARFFLFTSY